MGGGQIGGVSDGFLSYEVRTAVLRELHDHRVDVSVVNALDQDTERSVSASRAFLRRLGVALGRAASSFGRASTGSEKLFVKVEGPNSWQASPIGQMMMQPVVMQSGFGAFVGPRAMPLQAMTLSSFMISGRF